jgi:hypothetical protein
MTVELSNTDESLTNIKYVWLLEYNSFLNLLTTIKKRIQMKTIILTLLLLTTPFASAQRRGNPNDGRIQVLESQVRDLEYRVRTLELNGGSNRPKAYYCLAQCQGETYTQRGGRGGSQSEARQAAFDAVRKDWNCGKGIEVVECSPEY